MPVEQIGTGQPDGMEFAGDFTSSATAKTLVYNGNKLLNLACTCASTNASTSFEPFLCTTTLTGAGQVGGRAKFDLTINAAAGGWTNALKSNVTYGTSGSTSGLGSSICVEMTLSAGTSSGTYAPLEVELNLGSGAGTGTETALMFLSVNGADASTFDTNGYFMDVRGLTGAASKCLSLASQTLKTLVGGSTTRYLVLSQLQDGLGLGNSTTAMTLTTYANRAVEIYTTSASADTGNSVEPFYLKSTMTAANGVGGRARFHLYTNVALGGWSNALKGYVEYGASGRTTGLGSAVCAEILLSAGTTSGTYAPLESELVADSAVASGTATSFLYMNIAGSNSTGKTTINTNGFLFELGSGVVDTSGGMFEAEVVASCASTHKIRCRIGGTTYYIPLNTALNA